MMGGIDEVGTDLERLDLQASCGKRPHQSGCNGGLSAAAMGASDDYSWDMYFFI